MTWPAYPHVHLVRLGISLESQRLAFALDHLGHPAKLS